MKRFPPWLAPLALLSACNLAPPYAAPSVPTTAAFKEAGPAGVAWAQARPHDDADRMKWWLVYQDPVLNDLEDQVIVNNQTLKADEAAFREARALVVEARAALFPTLGIAPSYNTYRASGNVRSGSSSGSTGTAGGTGSSGTASAGTATAISAAAGTTGQTWSVPLEASYEIDLWGSIRNTVKEDAYNAQASAGDLANARLSLQAQLAEDYFELRATDEEQRIENDTIAAYREDLRIAQTLYRAGVDSDEDVAQAQAQLDTTIAAASDLAVSRAEYEHAIAVLVGKPPAALTLAVAPFRVITLPLPQVVPSQLLERRPDIAAAERRVAAANAAIGVARAAYFPTINLTGSAGFESSHLANLFSWPSRFWSLGPELSETLLDFGLRRGENENARATYDGAVATYRQTVLTAFQNVEDGLSSLRALANEVRLRQTAAASTHRYLGLSQTRFQAGIDSYLNVATAQTADLANQNSLVQTQLSEMLASISLLMATGGGWEVADLPTASHLTWAPAK